MLHASTTLVSEFVMLLALLLFGMRSEKIMLMDIYRWKIHTSRSIRYYYRLFCIGRVTELPITLRVSYSRLTLSLHLEVFVKT